MTVFPTGLDFEPQLSKWLIGYSQSHHSIGENRVHTFVED